VSVCARRGKSKYLKGRPPNNQNEGGLWDIPKDSAEPTCRTNQHFHGGGGGGGAPRESADRHPPPGLFGEEVGEGELGEKGFLVLKKV